MNDKNKRIVILIAFCLFTVYIVQTPQYELCRMKQEAKIGAVFYQWICLLGSTTRIIP